MLDLFQSVFEHVTESRRMKFDRGIFYRLTFQNDVEPEDFLTTLSTMIKEHPERNKSTRAGKFSRMAIFTSIHSQALTEGVIVRYLFLVEGSSEKLDWLVGLLEQFGKVSFPLDNSDWSFSSDIGILSAATP
jgi:hypothetical protein